MESKRNLTSYCMRYYCIQGFNRNIVGWLDIETIDKDLSEVAAMQYMKTKYKGDEVRLVQKIISEILYVVY